MSQPQGPSNGSNTSSGSNTSNGQHHVRFITRYYTNWGERVVVVGNHPSLGANTLSRAFPLTCRPLFADTPAHVSTRAQAQTDANPGSSPGPGPQPGASSVISSPHKTVTVMSALNHTVPARNALNAVRGQAPSSLVWEGMMELPVGVGEITVRLAVVRDDSQGVEGEGEGDHGPGSSAASPKSPLSPKRTWTLVKFAKHAHVIRLAGDRPLDVVATCTWVDASHPGGVLGASAFSGVFGSGKAADHDDDDDRAGDGASISSPMTSASATPTGHAGNIRVTLEVMDLELEVEEESSLCVTGGNKALGNWQPRQVVWMDKVKPGLWRLELEIPVSGFPITYKYAIGVRDSHTTDLILEPGENRLLISPDARGVFGGGGPGDGNDEQNGNGNGNARGFGEGVDNAMPASFRGIIPTDHNGSLEGAVGLREASRASPVDAHAAPVPPVAKDHYYYVFDGFLRRQDRWRAAGIALPVFSIRNRGRLCGQFSDLPALGAWCKSCGFSLLQLLPVCDTSVKNNWRDSYPYSSLCVFALHPMYLDVSELGTGERGHIEIDDRADVDDGPGRDPDRDRDGSRGVNTHVANTSSRSTSSKHRVDVDYDATMAFKMGAARRAFEQMGRAELASPAYDAFQKANSHWLLHYAVFCFLRDFFKTAEHWTWGVYAKPTAESIKHLSHPDREWHDTIRFYCYLQFKLHQQLFTASQALKAYGVVLKGDLPIGVDKCSVDTWQHPALFRMHTNTGAPPDYFDPKGQNWGFPTYNWEAMAKDDYAWWRRRLAHMSQYFQAYRIDHILGFFRIWELPAGGKTGILGRYRPSIGYSRAELERQGLWDIDRLAEPFITDELLHELFDDPELELEVKERFLEPSPGNRYRFKERYNSESAMFSLKCRPGLPDAAALDTERTRAVLILLSQNVCLIKDQDNPHSNYYPRFNLVDTSSFQYLPDAHWKATLRSMHDESFYGSRSDAVWRHQALKTLPMMQGASDMLVCGEDLGFIPPCVHPIMEELGIVGLRIQRMPSEPGTEFGDPEKYGYMTVASPSSHDTTNFRCWYGEDDDRRQRYCEQFDLADGEPPGGCSPKTVRAVIRQHLNSPSMLAIFSIQDIIGMSNTLPQRDAEEETINVPSNPEHYWRYRMHVSVSELAQDDELTSVLRAMIGASGRLRA